MTQELSYVPTGDYLLPGIRLKDEGGVPPVGRYGKLRQAFLREHCPERVIMAEIICER